MTNDMETLISVKPYKIWDLSKHSIISPSDILYFNDLYIIIDQFNHRLVWLNKDGEFIRSTKQPEVSTVDLVYPTSFCCDDNESLWITDRWNHCVKKLSPDGRLIGSIGAYGDKPGEFSEPWGIDYKNNTLIVSDRNNHRIQFFDTSGNFLTAFGVPGPDKEYYEGADFKNGFIYEHWKNIANKFVTFESLFFQHECSIGSFEYPQKLSVSESGTIAVVDCGNDRIQLFSHNGTPIGSVTTSLFPDMNDFFSDVFFLSDDTLLIAQELHNTVYAVRNNSVYKSFSIENGRLNLIARGKNNEILMLDSWNSQVAFFKWD